MCAASRAPAGASPCSGRPQRWPPSRSPPGSLCVSPPPWAPRGGRGPERGGPAAMGFAAGRGALAGMVYVSLARLRPAHEDLGLALLATLLFGAGIGYAADLSPFVVCALAAALIVNVAPAPRRH